MVSDSTGGGAVPSLARARAGGLGEGGGGKAVSNETEDIGASGGRPVPICTGAGAAAGGRLLSGRSPLPDDSGAGTGARNDSGSKASGVRAGAGARGAGAGSGAGGA